MEESQWEGYGHNPGERYVSHENKVNGLQAGLDRAVVTPALGYPGPQHSHHLAVGGGGGDARGTADHHHQGGGQDDREAERRRHLRHLRSHCDYYSLTVEDQTDTDPNAAPEKDPVHVRLSGLR